LSRSRLAPVLLALVLGTVYLATLLPGVGHEADTGEMQFCGYVLGVPHPTGYPTYVLLNHLFTRALPLGSVAWRANLLSAVFAVAAALLLYRLVLSLGARPAAALSAALTFGVTPTFWLHAVVAEVYSLHVLFVAATALAFLRWRRTGADRDLFVAGAVLALSFTHHLTTVTLLPAVAFLVLTTAPRTLLDPRKLAALVVFAALAALPYAYLVWRSRDPQTPYLAAETSDLSSLLAHVSGAQFRVDMAPFTAEQLLRVRLPLLLSRWWREFHALLLLVPLGLVRMKDRPAHAFLGLVFAGSFLFALNYRVRDVEVFLLPCHLVTAVYIGLGLDLVLDRLSRPVGWAVAAVLPLALGLSQVGEVQRAKGEDAAVRVRRLVETRGPALLLTSYHDFQFVNYMMLVEGRTGVFAIPDGSLATVRRYLVEGRPLPIPELHKVVPPGLPVYGTRANPRRRLIEAGYTIEDLGDGVYRVGAPPSAAR